MDAGARGGASPAERKRAVESLRLGYLLAVAAELQGSTVGESLSSHSALCGSSVDRRNRDRRARTDGEMYERQEWTQL